MPRLVIALGVLTCLVWPSSAAENPPGSNTTSGAAELSKNLPGPPAIGPNRWVKLDKADVKRPDAPLVYEPELKRFMVLGGSVGWPEYAQPHPFDELALDLGGGRWENWIPGQGLGPRVGRMPGPALEERGLGPAWTPRATAGRT